MKLFTDDLKEQNKFVLEKGAVVADKAKDVLGEAFEKSKDLKEKYDNLNESYTDKVMKNIK